MSISAWVILVLFVAYGIVGAATTLWLYGITVLIRRQDADFWSQAFFDSFGVHPTRWVTFRVHAAAGLWWPIELPVLLKASRAAKRGQL